MQVRILKCSTVDAMEVKYIEKIKRLTEGMV